MRIGAAHPGHIVISLGGTPLARLIAGSSSRVAHAASQALAPRARTATAGIRATGSLAAAAGLIQNLRGLVRWAPTGGPAPAPQVGLAVLPPVVTRPAFAARRQAFTHVRGASSSQVAGLSVSGLAVGQQLAIAGEVTQAASAARLTVRGGPEVTATSGGTYELTGSRGSIVLTIGAGEAFSELAARINARTGTTRVLATIEAGDLVLSSLDTGQSAGVQFRPLAIDPQLAVEGLNAAQVSRLTLAAPSPGGSETIAGTLLHRASAAELVYLGDLGGVAAGSASFRLSGPRGAIGVTIREGEALASIAQRINEHTDQTGVVATASGDDLRLTSDTLGSAASVQVDAVDVEFDQLVEGVNAAQVADFAVLSLAEGSEHSIGGQVLQTATAATVALQGSAGAAVIDSATFDLTGSLGSASIFIAQGESLADVAERINAASGATGVVAKVEGNQLLLTSSDVGSAARVEVQLTHVNHTSVVSGVNESQITGFEVTDFVDGAAHTLSGAITQSAAAAELTFTGNFLGLVGQNATFTLSGSLGGVQLSVSSLQSLNSLVSDVNQHSATTGVTAVKQGNQVKLRSTGVGSAATVAVTVTSGSFPVSGGNGDGTANGLDAVAVIDGQTITAAGNQFAFSDAVGSYSFTAVGGYTGSLSAVSITSLAGSFDVTGGGSASGLDALAEINGVQLTGERNRFEIGEAGGQFKLEFAPGFTGAFDEIAVRSVPDLFFLSGGDEAGLARGADFAAVINGEALTSIDGTFAVAGELGSHSLEFAADFAGDFDPITIASRLTPLSIVGGDADGRAVGGNARATINGQALTGEGSRFTLLDAGRRITIAFQPGFEGPFDSIAAEGKLRSVRSRPSPLASPPLPFPVAITNSERSADEPFGALVSAMAVLESLFEPAEEEEPLEAESNSSAEAGAEPAARSRSEIVRRQFAALFPDVLPEADFVYPLLLVDALRPAVDLRG